MSDLAVTVRTRAKPAVKRTQLTLDDAEPAVPRVVVARVQTSDEPQAICDNRTAGQISPAVDRATPFGELRKLSVRQAAAHAGVSAKTVRRAIERGDLRAFRPGGQVAIVLLEPDVDAWAFRPVTPRARRPRAAPPVTSICPRRSGEAGSVARLEAIERGEG